MFELKQYALTPRTLTEEQKGNLELFIAELEAFDRQTRHRLVTNGGQAMCAVGVLTYTYLKVKGADVTKNPGLAEAIDFNSLDAQKWCPAIWVHYRDEMTTIMSLNDY